MCCLRMLCCALLACACCCCCCSPVGTACNGPGAPPSRHVSVIEGRNLAALDHSSARVQCACTRTCTHTGHGAQRKFPFFPLLLCLKKCRDCLCSTPLGPGHVRARAEPPPSSSSLLPPLSRPARHATVYNYGLAYHSRTRTRLSCLSVWLAAFRGGPRSRHPHVCRVELSCSSAHLRCSRRGMHFVTKTRIAVVLEGKG